jgi:hypothetical protein
MESDCQPDSSEKDQESHGEIFNRDQIDEPAPKALASTPPLSQSIAQRGMLITNIFHPCLVCNCRYPADRIPLRTRLKSSPTTPDPALGTGGHRRRHVSHDTGLASRRGGGGGSGVATCPAVPDVPHGSWHPMATSKWEILSRSTYLAGSTYLCGVPMRS